MARGVQAQVERRFLLRYDRHGFLFRWALSIPFKCHEGDGGAPGLEETF